MKNMLSIGSVSYLNAKPLIYGLERENDLRVDLAVPAKLLEGLRAGAYDVALLPVIDYQRMEGLRVLTSGGIGCDGPTLTVRIFSRVPIEQIKVLACDTDSHTSVALARVILAERYGIRPELMDLRVSPSSMESVLLIGDKVVCEEPRGYPYQLDLGAAWKELTGGPFVFAAWMARQGVELGDLPARLERAKREGLAHVDEIIAEHAAPRGWPRDVARKYLTEYLKFEVTERGVEAIARFHELAAKHGVIGRPLRALVVEHP